MFHHQRRTHNSQQSPEGLYAKIHTNGVIPTCVCGCGTQMKLFSLQNGFTKWVRGHVSRVKNNWGHNKKALDKSHATCRVKRSGGEMEVWNKGLTKETDQRVADYGTTQSGNFTDERRKIRSVRMSKNRLLRIVPNLTGSQHPLWNGGSSALQPHVRSHVFNSWARPIMKRDNYTCQHCDQQSDLCVHHNGPISDRFAAILRKAIGVHGEFIDHDNFKLKEDITNWVVNYHKTNNTSGITLCYNCHMKAHSVEP